MQYVVLYLGLYLVDAVSDLFPGDQPADLRPLVERFIGWAGRRPSQRPTGPIVRDLIERLGMDPSVAPWLNNRPS